MTMAEYIYVNLYYFNVLVLYILVIFLVVISVCFINIPPCLYICMYCFLKDNNKQSF